MVVVVVSLVVAAGITVVHGGDSDGVWRWFVSSPFTMVGMVESVHGLMLKLESTYLVLKMALKECRRTCKN